MRLDGPGGSGAVVTFAVADYGHVEHGYAATIHKAQGVTMDRAHVLASGHMDRHAAYVALTRHRDGVALHYGCDGFADAAALARMLGRERLKDTSLDYDGARDGEALLRRYAERRGFDPLQPESAIVVPAPVLPAEPVQDVGLDQAVLAGRAGFRDRYEAHRRQQALARDEAAARDLVRRWDRLTEGFNAALPGMEIDPAPLAAVRAQLVQFGRDLGQQPAAVQRLREQGAAFGMAERQTLAQVLADPQPERMVADLAATAETVMRMTLRAAAKQEATRQQELAAKPRPRPSRGPSPGW